MKIKLLGLTVFEIQRDPSAVPTSRLPKANAMPPQRPPRAPTPLSHPLPWTVLHQPAAILPRTKRGKIDVEACLLLLGSSDTSMLWKHRFKTGTAGAALKCILGARGQKPAPRAPEGEAPNLETYPAKDLPLLPGTEQLDIEACLARFDIRDPAILWQRRFKPHSAGGRIKMFLRRRGFDPDSPEADLRKTKPRAEEPPSALPGDTTVTQTAPEETDPADGQPTLHGTADIPTALKALGITDPRALWQRPVEPGSAEHELKKAIARALAKREPVPGISRLDVGLSP
jgi:hypothetical protein